MFCIVQSSTCSDSLLFKNKTKKVERFWSTRKKNNMYTKITCIQNKMWRCLEMHMVTHNTKYSMHSLPYVFENSLWILSPWFLRVWNNSYLNYFIMTILMGKNGISIVILICISWTAFFIDWVVFVLVCVKNRWATKMLKQLDFHRQKNKVERYFTL